MSTTDRESAKTKVERLRDELLPLKEASKLTDWTTANSVVDFLCAKRGEYSDSEIFAAIYMVEDDLLWDELYPDSVLIQRILNVCEIASEFGWKDAENHLDK